ncbi:DgyrCDS3778 [Dimorphilus gyrociliatus]|uniref:DgyrCDS3778 n=1 Tax=Dimorphilus gyrociliatus TaxID=2664684 RepID=A0A7I8VEX8_9ANNE|nr:DgyrCDS3778 [Dimorphilus gyrociliatus]
MGNINKSVLCRCIDKQQCSPLSKQTGSAQWLPPTEAWNSTSSYGLEKAIDKRGKNYYIEYIFFASNEQYIKETSSSDSEASENEADSELRTVELLRDPNAAFGFVAGSEKPVVVRFVTEDGPSFGKLLPGDEIIRINDEYVEKSPREHVIELVRSNKTSITLSVKQPSYEKTQKCKKRRKRTVILPETLKRLEDVFAEERWPSRPAKLKLAQELNQTEQFVNIWFQNKRARMKREQAKIRQETEQSEDFARQQVQNFFEMSDEEDSEEVKEAIEDEGKIIFIDSLQAFEYFAKKESCPKQKILPCRKMAQMSLHGQNKSPERFNVPITDEAEERESKVNFIGELNFPEISLRNSLAICFQDQGRFIVDIPDDLLPFYLHVVLTYAPAFLRAQTIVTRTEIVGRQLKEVVDNHAVSLQSPSPRKAILTRVLDNVNIAHPVNLFNLPITVEYPGLRYHKRPNYSVNGILGDCEKTFSEPKYEDEKGNIKVNDPRYTACYVRMLDEHSAVEEIKIVYVYQGESCSTAYLGPRLESGRQPNHQIYDTSIVTPLTSFKQHINAASNSSMPVYVYTLAYPNRSKIDHSAHVIVEAASFK